LKQGDALSPLLFNCAVQYANRRVQVNKDDFQLNGIQQLLDYAYGLNILGGSVHTIRKTTGYVVVASKKIVVEVSADKTKYVVISRDQNAERSQNIKD
jgi:hypothetical protein